VGVILLVRHGQASWGAADYDNLSEGGHEQARLTGLALAARGVTPSRVVCGTMRRHRQTAAAAVGAAGWSAEATTDDGWNEFDHVQMLEVHGAPERGTGPDGGGLTRQEFDAWFDAATERWTSGRYDEDYDEPFFTFTSRVEAALRRTASGLGSGEAAVVFTSGGPISWVAATLLGGGIDMWMRLNPVTINASVAKVVVGARGTTLVSLNDHSHLEPDHVTYR
jgi:broad specificity phosphatase PhoE